MKTIKLLTILTLVFTKVFSQDYIIKKNNDQLKVKIIEITKEDIKYKFFDAPDGPTITISKSDVRTVTVGGKKDNVIDMSEDPMSVSNNAIMDKTGSIKFNFFSIMRNNVGVGYEWMLKPGVNWETGIGVVGVGKSILDKELDIKSSGFYIRTGPKFLIGNKSDFAVDGVRYAHPLKGRYIKIETILSTIEKKSFSPNFTTGSNTQAKVRFTGATFNLVYGRQLIVGNSLTVGYFCGLGYAFEKTTGNSENRLNLDPRRYTHTFYGKNFPMTTTVGFNIGYIIKAPDLRILGKQNNKSASRKSMN